MRIAIGQLWQETNTFNPIPTTRSDYEAFGVLRGDELVERMTDTNELGGMIRSLRRWNEKPQIVGLVRLAAWPGGLMTEEALRWIKQELIGALEKAIPVDALLLALHGSLAAVGTPDVEGEILDACRALIGWNVPLVATLDLHANITERMLKAADALTVYHTAPHIDVFETGIRSADLLRRILDGARPIMAMQKIPFVPPAERANTQDVASVSYEIRRILQDLEKDSRILSAGLATVQPWLDVPELGSAVIVVSDGAADLAIEKCKEIAAHVWARRNDYLPKLASVSDGVHAAFCENNGLVVISDSADATTSGAPGDSTHLLREMLIYDWKKPALVTMVDPEVVAEAARLGVGSELKTSIGGKRDSRFSLPLTVAVRVAKVFDSRFVMSGHLARNLPVDMGPSVLLQAGNIHIVVTSRSGPHFAPQLFQAAGLDPFAAQLLVAKSPCGFRAAYAPYARQIHIVNAPGCAPSDFWNYPYRHILRPLWPWDDIPDWHADPIVRSGAQQTLGHASRDS